MAKLTAKQRAKLPGSQFAGPNRTYPDEDKAHAADAKSRAAAAANSGRITRGTQARIDANANAVLKSKVRR